MNVYWSYICVANTFVEFCSILIHQSSNISAFILFCANLSEVLWRNCWGRHLTLYLWVFWHCNDADCATYLFCERYIGAKLNISKYMSFMISTCWNEKEEACEEIEKRIRECTKVVFDSAKRCSMTEYCAVFIAVWCVVCCEVNEDLTCLIFHDVQWRTWFWF